MQCLFCSVKHLSLLLWMYRSELRIMHPGATWSNLPFRMAKLSFTHRSFHPPLSSLTTLGFWETSGQGIQQIKPRTPFVFYLQEILLTVKNGSVWWPFTCNRGSRFRSTININRISIYQWVNLSILYSMIFFERIVCETFWGRWNSGTTEHSMLLSLTVTMLLSGFSWASPMLPGMSRWGTSFLSTAKWFCEHLCSAIPTLLC